MKVSPPDSPIKPSASFGMFLDLDYNYAGPKNPDIYSSLEHCTLSLAEYTAFSSVICSIYLSKDY